MEGIDRMKGITKAISFSLTIIMLIGIFSSVTFAKEENTLGQVMFFEDFENLSHDKVGFHSKEVKYCEFGSYSGLAEISADIAYSGSYSIKLPRRYNELSSLKVIDILNRPIEQSDVGKAYRISFMIYLDKNKGVYYKSASSRDEAKELYSVTEEDLAINGGTSISVTMSGPNGKNFKYRTGSEFARTFFVPWNEWFPVSYTYSVDATYLSSGSEDALSNPYIDSFRIAQNTISSGVNEYICDTFYIDDFRVEETGADIDYSLRGNNVTVLTRYTPGVCEEYSRTFIFEYSHDGRLLGSKVGEKEATRMNALVGNTCETYYVRKSTESDIYTVSFGSDISKPLYPLTKLLMVPEKYQYADTQYALERAKEMLNLSKAEYKDAVAFDDRLDNDNAYFFSADDVYTDSSKSDKSMGSSAYIKVSSETNGFLKFDISELKEKSASHSYIVLYPSRLRKGGEMSLYEYPHLWEEKTLTFANTDAFGDKITTFKTDYAEVVNYIDVTSFVNKALASGKTELSFVIKSEGADVDFVTKETTLKSFRPSLILEGTGLKEREKKVSSFDYSNYDVVMKRKNTPKDTFVPTPTRNLDSVKDFKEINSMPELNKYGSPLHLGKREGTGFFRTELIDGRWWIIDPEGYRQMHIAVSRVEADKSEKFDNVQKNAFEQKYGTDENWANMVVDELRPYGFNACGPWSDYQIMLGATEKTPLVQSGYKANFIKGYDKTVDENDNMLNVFDPMFEVYADNMAKTYFAPYADSPYILGWMTDNEPMANSDMLLAYLNCDKSKRENQYNYYTAWEWLKSRYGENAKVTDITEKDKDDWVEFVFDRYMKVCTDAIRKYDKNHMIIGPKLDKPSKGSFRGISKWVDIVAYDYYGNAWDADMAQVNQWYMWAGKPLINAEWYVKGMDAITPENDLTNESGVGWTVETQKERVDYYQSFVLDMIESGVFVGWQWFRYTDNVGGPSNGSSNPDLNSNKGIYTRDYKPYTETLEGMYRINRNVYELIKYFDK